MSRRKPKGEQAFASWLALPAEEPAACQPTNPELPVLVIGAGPGGLAAMAALSQAGVAFEAIESHAGVGGIWDVSNPMSTVYEGLHMVTSRFTSFLGPMMPSEWPDYPDHAQALEYLQHFASSEGLLPRIQFETEFRTATKTPRGTWQATLRRTDSDETYEREFRALVMATGSYNKLHRSVPCELHDQAIACGLDVIHSADYTNPEPYAGKRVLVVGIGTSGTDIAEKISRVAARTLLAVRTSPWINPPFLGTTPCDKFVLDGSSLPEWLGMGIFHFARRRAIGSNRRLGLRRPNFALNDRVPVTDRGIVRAIHEGRVIVRSNVTEFTGDGASFADPRHTPEKIDAVIFATGFARHDPMLSAEPTEHDQLLFHLFHRHEPGLVFMTEAVGLRSCWPIFAEQGQAIAAYFAAEQRGSCRVDGFNTRRGLPTPPLKGKLLRLADEYSVDYEIYTAILRDLVQWFSSET